jgi:hypothetical protein
VKPFTKDFTETIKFTRVVDVSGDRWFPIVEVALVKPTGQRVPLKLLFDTGATQITLRGDHGFLFTDVEEERFQTAKGEVQGRIAKNQTIEFLGVSTSCDIGLLDDFPERVFVGIFGRDCFKPFGFGFWENARELYVTLKL